MCAVFKHSKRRNIPSGLQTTPPKESPVQIAQKATRVAFERTAWKRAPKQKPMPAESTKPEELTPQQKRMQAILTGKPKNPKFTKSRFLRKR